LPRGKTLFSAPEFVWQVEEIFRPLAPLDVDNGSKTRPPFYAG
jgi:hypothetical protein